MATTLILVRHGEARAGVDRIIGGRDGWALDRYNDAAHLEH